MSDPRNPPKVSKSLAKTMWNNLSQCTKGLENRSKKVHSSLIAGPTQSGWSASLTCGCESYNEKFSSLSLLRRNKSQRKLYMYWLKSTGIQKKKLQNALIQVGSGNSFLTKSYFREVLFGSSSTKLPSPLDAGPCDLPLWDCIKAKSFCTTDWLAIEGGTFCCLSINHR